MYYFTFGAGQEHDGCYVLIHAADYLSARTIMAARFGVMWSGQYTEQQFRHLGLHGKMNLIATYEGEWYDIF